MHDTFKLKPCRNDGELVQKIGEDVRKKLQPIIDEMYAIQVPAKKLIIDNGDKVKIWRRGPLKKDERTGIPSYWSADNSGEGPEIAEVINEYWLHVWGKYEVSELREGWKYEIHFVMKLKHDLEMESLGKFILDVPGGISQQNIESLYMKPKEKWVEVKVGEFVAQNRKGNLEFHFYASDDDTIRKSGICILGARIVPVFFPRLNIPSVPAKTTC
ncbi:protein PHLOEM PROTEIN 2-LIKE A2-like isoform X1 [Apium graveolens]|uniref:protein PHLOEM PROTEIN 2-LIKE A2-like isoform X1 n=2 Tax=Apium graveolens TaxID=4045 RepID=UPI003D796F98